MSAYYVARIVWWTDCLVSFPCLQRTAKVATCCLLSTHDVKCSRNYTYIGEPHRSQGELMMGSGEKENDIKGVKIIVEDECWVVFSYVNNIPGNVSIIHYMSSIIPESFAESPLPWWLETNNNGGILVLGPQANIGVACVAEKAWVSLVIFLERRGCLKCPSQVRCTHFCLITL